jgi:hypothetical protein
MHESMRWIVPLAFALPIILAPTATFCQGAKPDVVVQNVHVFNVARGRFSDLTNIVIRDGVIRAVGRTGIPAGARRIAGNGGYALPGLWDSHVHLAFVTLNSPDSVALILKQFVQHGVLYVRDVGGPTDVVARMHNRIERGELPGPEIFFAGPMAEHSPMNWADNNKVLPGFTVPMDTPEQVDSLVSSVAAAGGTLIKAFGKWDLSLLRRLVAEAKQHGRPRCAETSHVPSIHANTVSDSARGAFARTVIPLGRESLNPDRLNTIAQLWRDRGAAFTPTLRVIDAWRRDPPHRPGFSPDQLARFYSGMWDGASTIARTVASAGVTILIGQDGIDPTGAAEEMAVLVANGVPPAQVLQAATINPARWLGRDDRLGSTCRAGAGATRSTGPRADRAYRSAGAPKRRRST